MFSCASENPIPQCAHSNAIGKRLELASGARGKSAERLCARIRAFGLSPSLAQSDYVLGTPVLGYCILVSFGPRRYSDGTETGRRALAFAQVAHTPRSRQVHPQVSYARDPTVMDPAAWDKRLKYDAEWILEGYIQRLKDLHEKAMRRIEHLKQEGLRTEQQAHHPAYTRYTTP
jgi:hypothetical protein